MSIYVLFMSGFYLTLGLTLLSLHLGAFQDTRNSVDTNQARLIAQTAIQEARYYARNIDSNWSGTSNEFSFSPNGTALGTYRYTISKTGNKYTLTGIGYVPNSTSLRKVTSTLTAEMRNPNPQTIYSEGFESGLNPWTDAGSDAGTSWIVTNTEPAKQGTYCLQGYRTAAGGGTRVARIVTPTLDLSSYDQVVLRFSWRSTGSGTRIRVYMNPGSGWTQIHEDDTDNYDSAYIRPAVRYNITGSTNLTNTVQFRFEAHMDAIGEGYLFDEVALLTPLSPYNTQVDQ